MRLVPESNQGKVDFYQTHIGNWQAHAQELEIPPNVMSALAQNLQEAREAIAAQSRARQEAETATQRANTAVQKLSRLGGSTILRIRARAQVTDAGIYTIAQIPPLKKNRTTVAPPGVPHTITTSLLTNGWVRLGWKSRNPRAAQGVMYEIKRRIGNDGPWEKLGDLPKKRYIDRTIPPGTAQVEYRIRAFRPNDKSDWAIHLVEFGSTFNPPIRDQAVYGLPPGVAA